MKRIKLIALAVVTTSAVLTLIYITSQKPRAWCSRQWAGIALLKGGYRSWTVRFCDGEAYIGGKRQPVVVTTNGFHKGYYSWPMFSHIDTRKIKITGPNPTNILKVNVFGEPKTNQNKQTYDK